MPLHGLSVVELGHFVSAPYCARLLADSGAEVIKVEGPEGDEARRRGPFPDDLPDPNRSGLFLYLNANKLGITLDLRSSLARKLFFDLLKDADILVENNPPGEMDALGLDFPSLHKEYPRLIVTSVTPFGQTGPYRDYLGDDLIAANMGGLTYATPGIPDQVNDPVREPPLRPATYVADFTAGIAASVATMLAVLAREWDGLGRHVDVSEQEAVASTLTWDLATTSYLGLIKRRGARLGYGLMPNCYLPCKDGYVVITAITQEHWLALVEVMGSPDWADSELFRDGMGRSDNWDALRLLILEWTMAHTGREIYEAAQARGIPCYPANEVSQGHYVRAGGCQEVLARDGSGAGPGSRIPRTPLSIRGRPPAPANAGAAAGRAHQYPVVGAPGIHRPGACQAQGDGGSFE